MESNSMENSRSKKTTSRRKTPRRIRHDFSPLGLYMITLEVRDRQPLLGRLEPVGEGEGEARLVPTELGRKVEEEFRGIKEYYPQIDIVCQQLMPDYWQGLIRVKEELPRNLSVVIAGFQGGCSRALWDQEDIAAGLDPKQRPIQRVHQRPGLFVRSQIDGIVLQSCDAESCVRYIKDNPRRGWIKELHPDLMSQCRQVEFEGCTYTAYGNIFLLDRPDKQEVVWEQGELQDRRVYAREREKWLAMARQGRLLVNRSAGKAGESILSNCVREHISLIHIQDEPIDPSWTPQEKKVQYACTEGRLLLLSKTGK